MNRCITLCCFCAPSFVTRDRFCGSISKKVSTAKVQEYRKCGEIRQGPNCLVCIREYRDFGDPKPKWQPVVPCEADGNMFNVYVYGSVRKLVVDGERELVRDESLSSSSAPP
jgi:hypothetical protein